MAAMSASQAKFQDKQQRGYHQHKRNEFSYLAFAHGLGLLKHGWSVPSASGRAQYAAAAERSIRRMP
jgi:hypothetical protein